MQGNSLWVESLLWEAWNHARGELETFVRGFGRSLEGWLGHHWPTLHLGQWRDALDYFLSDWERDGITIDPQSYDELVAWIQAWEVHLRGSATTESTPNPATSQSSPIETLLGGPGEVTLGMGPGIDDAIRPVVPANVEETLEEIDPSEPPPDDFELGPQVEEFAREHSEIWAEFVKAFGAGASGGAGLLKAVLATDWKIRFEPTLLAKGYHVYAEIKTIIISTGSGTPISADLQAAALRRALADISVQKYGPSDEDNARIAIRESAGAHAKLVEALEAFGELSEAEAEPAQLAGPANRIDLLHAQFEAALIAAMKAHLRYSRTWSGTGIFADSSLLEELCALPVLIGGLPVSRSLVDATRYYNSQMAQVLRKGNENLDTTIAVMERTERVADTITFLGGPAMILRKQGMKAAVKLLAKQLIEAEIKSAATDVGMGVVEHLGGREAVETVDKLRRGVAALRAFRALSKLGAAGTLGLAAGRKGKKSTRSSAAGARPSLRERMGAPPARMKKPEAHHDLPQKFRDKFERPGIDLDIDDPKYGRWVEGGPAGNHQKWSAEFELEWGAFFTRYPRAIKQQILARMQELRADPRFQ